MTDLDLSKLKIEKTRTVSSPRRRSRKYIWISVAAVAIIAVLYISGVLSPAVDVKSAPVSVVYPSQTFTKLNASGYVVAQRKAALAAKATGRLVWLGVQEGSHVQKGQVIARLENEDVSAVQAQADANLATSRAAYDQSAANVVNAKSALEQAQAELADSKLNIDRMKDLLARGIVAKSDYDSADARYKKALASVEGTKSQIRASSAAMAGSRSGIRASEAALKGAEVNVEYTLIRAPFDAVVLTKNADLGDIVTPIGASVEAKAAVVTIADMGSLEVEADVSESNLGLVKEGQPCELQLDALPDLRFRGVVATIVPTADRSKASVMVKVRFIDMDKRILPEMSAKVAFLEHEVRPGEDKPRLGVNPSAVVKRGGKQAVFIIKDGKAYETPVTLGGSLGEWVEVTSGLKAGDKVATGPVDKLRNGTKVKETAE